MSNRPEVPEPFGVSLEPHREAIVISLRGEIDINSSDEISARYHDVLEAGFRRIVLDLREVSFLDSTGLHAILAMNSASRQAGVRFALLEGRGSVQRIFELTNTRHTLRFIAPDEVDGGWS